MSKIGRIFSSSLRTALCAAIAIGFSTTANAIDFRTVALTGTPAPGTSLNFEGLRGNPVINNAGQVAFAAFVDINNNSNGAGIWSEGSGSLSLVARFGNQAPGVPASAVFGLGYGSDFFAPLLDDAGRITFFAGLATGTGGVTSSNNEGTWTGPTGGLSLLARKGSSAPGTDGNFGTFVQGQAVPGLAVNSPGQIVFTGNIEVGGNVTANNDTGIWSNNVGPLSLIAREGSQAPGVPAGANFGEFTWFNDTRPVINDLGRIAFTVKLQAGSGGVTSQDDGPNWNDGGVWAQNSVGTLELIARSGSQAPGTPAGAIFDYFSRAVLNNAGDVSFSGRLQTGSGGVNANNDAGLWAKSAAGPLTLIAREGDAAPGTGAGVNFANMNSFVHTVSSTGSIVFGASLAGPGVSVTNDTGLWTNRPGSLALLLREGDAAAGTGPGTVFGPFGTSGSYEGNSHGSIAFIGLLAGAGVTSANDRGLWAEDPSGALQLISREGDLFEVAPGDLRTISFVSFHRESGVTSGEDGYAGAFNDNYQLAFMLDFTDGSSGWFVATIPEPATISLIVLGGIGLLWQARRKK